MFIYIMQHESWEWVGETDNETKKNCCLLKKACGHTVLRGTKRFWAWLAAQVKIRRQYGENIFDDIFRNKIKEYFISLKLLRSGEWERRCWFLFECLAAIYKLLTSNWQYCYFSLLSSKVWYNKCISINPRVLGRLHKYCRI